MDEATVDTLIQRATDVYGPGARQRFEEIDGVTFDDDGTVTDCTADGMADIIDVIGELKIYHSMISSLIEQQKEIIGSPAINIAKNSDQLEVTEDGDVACTTADPLRCFLDLVEEYENVVGPAVGVTAKKILASVMYLYPELDIAERCDSPYCETGKLELKD